MSRSQLPRGHVRFYDNGGSKLLRLPQDVARLVTVDQIWQIEPTDDGILLRAIDPAKVQQLPKWATSSTPNLNMGPGPHIGTDDGGDLEP